MVCGHIKQTGIPKKKGAYMHRCGPLPLLYCTKDYIIELKTEGLPPIPFVGGDMM